MFSNSEPMEQANIFNLLQSHGTACLWASATEIRHQLFSFEATRKSIIEVSFAIWVMCHLLHKNTTGIGCFLKKMCTLEEAFCWKKQSFGFVVPSSSSKKLTLFTFIGGLLCHFCTRFHLFLDLLSAANHLYREVVPIEKVKFCFKVTYEIPFHILNLAHWK